MEYFKTKPQIWIKKKKKSYLGYSKDNTLSRGWPVTDRGGRASLLPYTPAGVTGSGGDNDFYHYK